jgi:hypothetical protein
MTGLNLGIAAAVRLLRTKWEVSPTGFPNLMCFTFTLSSA